MRAILFVAALALAPFAATARQLVVGIVEQQCEPGGIQLDDAYAAAVEQAGFVPFVIPCTTNGAVIAETVARLDILLMTGGADVNPARYHAEKTSACGEPNDLRDAFELALVAAARRRRLPLAGICRGMQSLNVAFGGTLWQDLPSEFKSDVKIAHRFGDWDHLAEWPVAHLVTPVPGTRFAEVLGAGALAVNSHHHQAVKDVAPGLRVAARSPDGLVEAVEGIDYPVFAVQFHPELVVTRCRWHSGYDHKRFEALFRALPRLCGMEEGK